MDNYVIYTDSSCDLDPNMLRHRGVYYSSLSFHFDGDDIIYFDHQISSTEFYQRMRSGEKAKTSAINSECFIDDFRKILDQGYDILYIGFSSGLSSTYNSARLASEQLKYAYPQRKILTIDTLSASAGIAMLIDMVIDKKHSGATIEEAKDFAEKTKKNICHYFTVDNLEYLKQGGRISASSALLGNMLGIKPLLYVNSEGRLVSISKIRGRKMSIMALADKFYELNDEAVNKIAYISHADCEEEAKELKKHIEDKYNARVPVITNIGSVIGAHSGPGTIAIFFVGKKR